MLKLNIYQEGDFFVPHRDTPLSEDSIGSLVIALPVAHRGGNLIVSHRHWDRCFAFEQDIAPFRSTMEAPSYEYRYEQKLKLKLYSAIPLPNYSRDESDATMTKDRYLVQCGTARNVISYAAFYGDCLHEIEPVTMGMRLTLSYQLVRVSSEEGHQHIQPFVVPSDPVDANMITVPRFIHDPELAEITRLMQVKPLELDRTTFLQTFSTAVLKYLTIASNRYGTTLSDLKLELFGHLTHLPDPKRLPMPPLPAIDTTLALSRTDGLRNA